jgi:DHA3 family macrolide efflux protein-like MFS transporter
MTKLFSKLKNNKNLVVFLSSQLISVIGSEMTAFAISIEIFKNTGSVSQFSLLLAANFIPSILISFFSGVWADNHSRKKIVILSDFGAAITTLILIYLFSIGNINTLVIVLLFSFRSLFNGLQTPSIISIASSLVRKEKYGNINGAMSLIGGASNMLSPLLAGAVLYYSSIETIFLIDLITFLIAAFLIQILNIPDHIDIVKKQPQSFFTNFKLGFKLFINTKGFLPLFTISGIVTASISAGNTIMTPIVLTAGNSNYLAVTTSFYGISFFISSMIMSYWGGGKKKSNNLKIFIPIMALGLFLISIKSQLSYWIIGVVFLGLSQPFVGGTFAALRMQNTPKQDQGKLAAFYIIFRDVISLVTTISAGIIADMLSRNSNISQLEVLNYMMLTLASLLAVAALISFTSKSIKRLDKYKHD